MMVCRHMKNNLLRNSMDFTLRTVLLTKRAVEVVRASVLAQAMKIFIQQPGLIEAMGRRSREIAEEKYDVHKINQVMLDVMGLQ